jgi:hypothetical protein
MIERIAAAEAAIRIGREGGTLGVEVLGCTRKAIRQAFRDTQLSSS